MSMTPALRFYWRRWGAVRTVNQWVLRRGVWACDVAKNRAASEWHAHVWEAAESCARDGHRAPTEEDLRHGCHIVAAGWRFSSQQIAPKDMDRLIGLWGNGKSGRAKIVGLLIDPLDLVSLDWWTHADERGSRKRREHIVRTAAPEAYTQAIVSDQFPGPGPVSDGLQPVRVPVADHALDCLTVTLSKRTDRFTSPIQASPQPGASGVVQPAEVLADDNEPF